MNSTSMVPASISRLVWLCLAGPGETIISPEARDALVPGLDVDIEDLGDCYLKHLPEPQRAYRASPIGRRSVMWAGPDRRRHRPCQHRGDPVSVARRL